MCLYLELELMIIYKKYNQIIIVIEYIKNLLCLKMYILFKFTII